MKNSADIIDMTESFQRGEEKGFNYFYNSLYGTLVCFGYRILNEKQAAKDIVNESFVRIWESHELFSHHQIIKAWLYKAVKNACLNHMASNNRKSKHHQNIQIATLKRHPDDILSLMIKAEVIQRAKNYMETLPAGCKKVFYLMYKEGLSMEETAKKLNLSISTVKNQKRIGLEKLRKLFGFTKEQFDRNVQRTLTTIKKSSLLPYQIGHIYNLDADQIRRIRTRDSKSMAF